jgi:hypothetical protein
MTLSVLRSGLVVRQGGGPNTWDEPCGRGPREVPSAVDVEVDPQTGADLGNVGWKRFRTGSTEGGREMEVEYQLLPEDELAFRRYHMAHPAASPNPSQRTLICLALSALCLGMFLVNLLGKPKDYILVAVGGIGSVLFLVYALLFYFRRMPVAGSLRAWLGVGGSTTQLPRQRLIITPEGVTASSELSSSTTRWPGVRAVAVTQDHAFIYISPTSAFVVPKRAFREVPQFEEFVAMAQRYQAEAKGVK